MSSRKIIMGMMMVIVAVVTVVGCQQKKNQRRVGLGVGRNLRGANNLAYQNDPGYKGPNNSNQCGSYTVPGKTWGQVTAVSSEEAFWNELYRLTLPALRTYAEEDKLGYVSGRGNQTTGVRFWGHAQTTGGNGVGAVDPNSAELRIEIYDDKTCQPKADGTARPMIPIHINSKLPGFVRAGGSINSQNGYARLEFEDTVGSIIMDGYISGNYYQGTMSYTLRELGGNANVITLGRFDVMACNFFVCN